MMQKILVDFFYSFKELCFPAVCIICKESLGSPSDVHLCLNCLASFKLVSPPYCLQCGKSFSGPGKNHLCSACITDSPVYTKARSIFFYNDKTAKIVHEFKYGGKTTAFPTFAGLKKQSSVMQDLFDPDIVIPVPLHSKRLKERGFNQAQLLARMFFSDRKYIIDSSTLCRQRRTEPQTGLSGRERRKNLKGAFSVRYPELIKDRKVILVDDVFTTGTTLAECAKTLKDNGAQEVQALTLARVAV